MGFAGSPTSTVHRYIYVNRFSLSTVQGSVESQLSFKDDEARVNMVDKKEEF